MKKLVWRLLSLLFVFAAVPLASAADAPELNVEHSILINARPEVVWEIASDFNGITRWLPTIAASRIIAGKNHTVGCIRELTRANGTKVEERLVEYDDTLMTMTYTYVGGQVMATDYFSTLTVSEAGDGKSKVVWKARFKRLAYWTDEPPAGQDDATPLTALNKVYPLGLQALKKAAEGK
jgi:hypothetical protein